MVKIDIKGLSELRARLKNLPQELKQKASAVVENGSKTFVRNAQRDAPMDVGFLQKQITYKKISDTLFEIISGSAYSAYMEFGTKSRVKIPAEFIQYAGEAKADGTGKLGVGFYDSILEWVKRKGFAALKTKGGGKGNSLESTIAQEQAAFAIYLSIIRHGVKPHPFFFKQIGPAKIQVERELKANINEIKL